MKTHVGCDIVQQGRSFSLVEDRRSGMSHPDVELEFNGALTSFEYKLFCFLGSDSRREGASCCEHCYLQYIPFCWLVDIV